MILKGLIDEDYSNYKKCSMFIAFPNCSLKCDKENDSNCCQNSALLKEPDIQISVDDICRRYMRNPLSHAIVIGGLEPFDSFYDLIRLIAGFRQWYDCKDDIVIYTGYTEQELENKILTLRREGLLLTPLLIKFGRFRPNQQSHHDDLLGVDLMNDEQYAKWVK